MSSLLLLGTASISYSSLRWITRRTCQLFSYFRNVGNSKKYLNSSFTTPSKQTETYSAVIYGASQKAGKAYAHFLAKQGFNLILIERDAQSLNHLEVNLTADLLSPPSLITKITIDRFDQDSLYKAVGGNQQLKEHLQKSPCKIFVNCKNSRRKAPSVAVQKQQMKDNMIDETVFFNDDVSKGGSDQDHNMKPEQKEALRQLWQPAITKEEVFFTSKENIEGFAALLAHFLPLMLSPSIDHPCLINIDHHDEAMQALLASNQGDSKGNALAGQLFYQSVVQFKDTFTENLPKHTNQRLKSITVKVDLGNIPFKVNSKYVQDSLCQKVLDQMSLRQVVNVYYPKIKVPAVAQDKTNQIPVVGQDQE